MMDQSRSGFPCRFSCRSEQTGKDTVFRPRGGTVPDLVVAREERDAHELAAHGQLFAKPYVAVVQPLGALRVKRGA